MIFSITLSMKTSLNIPAWLFLLPLLGTACGSNKSAAGDYEPVDSGPVEINRYGGEKLSSSMDFRENSIRGPQQIDLAEYSLEVFGMVENPGSFSYEKLIARESVKKVVDMHCVEGWNVKILWEGFRLKDLLDEAGLEPGTNTVIFHCYDGYTTFLSLNYIMVNDILLAYKMNNAPLRPERGFPFQLVAENKLGYKWARWVTKIEVTGSAEGSGYWENLGYPPGGDLDDWYYR